MDPADPRIGWLMVMRRGVLLALCLGPFLGIIGPFGSWFNGPLIERMAYWTGMMLAGAILYGSCAWLVAGWSRDQRSALLLEAVSVPIASLPMAVLSRAVAVTLWPAIVPVISWPGWYLETLLISLPIAAIHMAFLYRRSGNAAENAPPSAGSGPVDSRQRDLLSRLPARLGREVVCLQMEDHYVRIHTRQGSHLELMRFGDAIAALAPIEGLQVHRSWWIARAAIAGFTWQGRNLRARLVNDLEVPVARTAVARLREAGLLAGNGPPSSMSSAPGIGAGR